MIIQPFSYIPKKTNVDLLVGDWDMGLNTGDWNDKVIDIHSIPMIKVPGNHDYWNTSKSGEMTIDEWNQYYKSLENEKISYLINETKIINGVAFIGATLWTDFRDNDLLVQFQASISKDYEKIYSKKGQLITPQEVYELHIEAKNFIISELDKHSDKPCVVLTHFPPSIGCNQTFRITPVSYNWCGQMENVISIFQPVLWISGHMHNFYNNKMGDTRVILNPAG